MVIFHSYVSLPEGTSSNSLKGETIPSWYFQVCSHRVLSDSLLQTNGKSHFLWENDGKTMGKW
jgi:hypothetical protein